LTEGEARGPGQHGEQESRAEEEAGQDQRAAGEGATQVITPVGQRELGRPAAALTGAIRVAAAAALEQPGRRVEIAKRVFDLLASGLSRFDAE